MSGGLPDLTARVRLDTSDLDAGVKRATFAGSAIGGAIGGVAAQGIEAGVRAIGSFVKGSIDAARESQAIGRTTEAIIKATGSAAGLTAEQVGGLSERLSKVTGIDDEVIQGASNLLLTFKNVKNGVGEGAQVFDRANAAALDLSKAGFGSVEGGAKMLGKALNDPLKGMTALSRAGVTFSAEQTEAVKKYVASGDLLKAQQVILGEVEAQVGGVAAATATNADRFKVAIGNVQETIGGGLTKAFDAFAGLMLDRVGPALAKVQPLISYLGLAFGAFFAALRGGDVTSDGLVGAFETVGDAIHRALPALQAFIGSVRDALMPVLATVGGFIRDNIVPILGGILVPIIGALAGAVGGALVGGLVALVGALASPAVLIAALAAALIYAYRESEAFRGVVEAVASFIVTTVVPAFAAVAAGVVQFAGEAIGFVRENWPAIREVIEGVVDRVAAVIEAFVAVATTAWKLFGDDVLQLATAAFGAVKETITNAFDVIKGVFNVVLGLLTGDWQRAWDGIKGIVSAVWAQILNVIDLAWEGVKALFGAAFSALAAAAEAGWGAIKGAASSAWEGIKTVVSTAIGVTVDFVKALPGRFVDALSALASKLASAATTGWNAFDAAVDTAVGAVLAYVKATPQRFVDNLQALAGLLRGAATAAWNAFDGAVDSGVATTLAFVRGVPGKVVSALGNLGGLLTNAGRQLMEGLARGIGEKIETVVGKVRDAVALIGRLLPGSPIKDGPLKSWNNGGAGKRLMGMLGDGITAGAPELRRTMTGVLNPLSDLGAGVGASRVTDLRPGLAATAGAGSSSSLTLNVDVTNVGGPMDEDALATSLGRMVQLYDPAVAVA